MAVEQPEVIAMREWLVGGALVEQDDRILLVQNLRRNGSTDWTPPGGVIDEDEDLLSGLTREVLEETGLAVTSWQGPVYEIEAIAPGLGWHLRVEVWAGTEFEGELVVDDPDGIVIDAQFVTLDEHEALLAGTHQWVMEPLCEYLDERWAGARRYDYHVAGARLADLVVTRR
jgi:ADP-ribose pyrophosphatase YjhB (NUDIX family)